MIHDKLFVNDARFKPIDFDEKFWYKVSINDGRAVRYFQAPVLKMVKAHVERMAWDFIVEKISIEILSKKPDRIDVIIK
jgi:hypothetical protein